MDLKTKHGQLLSRIEDQLLQKFNKEFPYSEYVVEKRLRKEECLDILTNWLRFWIAEKPIMKEIILVLQLKEIVCENKIYAIYQLADFWNLLEELPADVLI